MFIVLGAWSIGDYVWDYIGEYSRAYIGVMEKKMETTV